MISGSVAFIFGALQALLLKSLLFSFTSGNYAKAAVMLFVKLITYAAAASLLVFVFDGYIISCAVGYTIGLPVTVAAYFIYGTVKCRSSHSGDGENENTDDN